MDKTNIATEIIPPKVATKSKQKSPRSRRDTLCWDCARSWGELIYTCPWADTQSETVPGWDATEYPYEAGGVTYTVHSCPLFMRDKKVALHKKEVVALLQKEFGASDYKITRSGIDIQYYIDFYNLRHPNEQIFLDQDKDLAARYRND